MKIGDKIKCQNDRNSQNLYRGNNYVVVDVNGYGNIKVRNEDTGSELEHYYKPERFVLVRESVTNKIDITNEYQTRNGNKVKLFAVSDDETNPIVGQYEHNGRWYNESWTDDGFVYVDGGKSDFDLVEAKPNVYWFGEGDIQVDIDMNEVTMDEYKYSFNTILALAEEIKSLEP